MKNKYYWRRLFSIEFTRADYSCDDVWIRNDKFKLVKFPSSLDRSGKWGIFTPLDDFIARTASSSVPIKWANEVIAEKMHDKNYSKEDYNEEDPK
jgi:hypothetical protein